MSYLGVDFKKTLSLSYLLYLISENESVSEDIYLIAEALEDYGVAIRYPGYSELTREDVEEA